jgi:hypothetical protein
MWRLVVLVANVLTRFSHETSLSFFFFPFLPPPGSLHRVNEPYDPNFLDNDMAPPDKHRITINLACYRQSIIPFVKKNDLKKAENEAFVERHPWLRSNITLSKIRSVKRKIMQISIQKSLDVSTAALSYVYFEKLVLQVRFSRYEKLPSPRNTSTDIDTHAHTWFV